jgi:hypothetical protein
MKLPRVVLAAILPTLAACAPMSHDGPGSAVAVDRLYFGRNTAHRLAVSETDWKKFLEQVVTPRFPDGLTTWSAEGQWRNADGSLEREPSFVVELVHPRGAETDRKVDEIAAEYKRRFRQEAVMQLRMSGRASF